MLPGVFGLWRPAFPIRATKSVPYGSKTDFIRVGVLDDKPFQPVWSPCDDAEAHRAAVVLKIQPEVTKTGLSEKRLDYLGGLCRRCRRTSSDLACLSCRSQEQLAETDRQAPVLDCDIDAMTPESRAGGQASARSRRQPPDVLSRTYVVTQILSACSLIWRTRALISS